MTDAAEMADWESACMEMAFSMERLCQAALASGDSKTVARLREWLVRWTALSASLHAAMTPEVAAA